ncbi:hypothetical protein [Saccharothrix coeruleofusca]|uniref:Secreted protein n=1 Tax=Saccharothrix coeruleofusca TaxID=33919 RepID=A0A918EI44_9PSEU|nr:hypothetical protein [Saccharothrix coeruleofusca]MBP2337313.1 hypothetical protein [Saccharothrix coeruleofusca]GGP81556.1 hypothetical protein GCM10010185_64430 [Saccharothrix coeruleofusca]
MRSSTNRKRIARTAAALVAAAGALVVTAGASAAATGAPAAPVPADASASAGCVTTDIHLDPAAREVGWTVECADRRYVFADITVFAGGVADSNPREAKWVEAGGTWQDLNVYPQTTPPIDHLCVHLVSYVDPNDPFEQPQVIGHACV